MPIAPAPAPSWPRLLRDYGPRVGVFLILLGVVAGLLALRAHLKAQEASDVGMRLDRALSLPDAQRETRIETLRTLLRDYGGCDAEPWILLALGNQLYQKATTGSVRQEADALNTEAYALYKRVYEGTPDHAAAPLALFSAGCTAEQMGRATDATRLYGDLKQDYPSTYLVVGSGDSSFQKFRTEGLNERLDQLRKAFPEGVLPEPSPPLPLPAAPPPS